MRKKIRPLGAKSTFFKKMLKNVLFLVLSLHNKIQSKLQLRDRPIFIFWTKCLLIAKCLLITKTLIVTLFVAFCAYLAYFCRTIGYLRLLDTRILLCEQLSSKNMKLICENHKNFTHFGIKMSEIRCN